MDGTNQQVLTIYKFLNGLPGRGVDKWSNRRWLDKELSILYGLPVVQEVLKNLDVTYVVINGYPLRYGCYLWRQLRSTVEPDTSGHRAFVSYARENEMAVHDELRWLRQNKLRFWYDKGIAGGEHWMARISKEIEASDVVLFFSTAASINSTWVQRELAVAGKMKKRIVQLRLDEAELKDGLDVLLRWPIASIEQTCPTLTLLMRSGRRHLANALRLTLNATRL